MSTDRYNNDHGPSCAGHHTDMVDACVNLAINRANSDEEREFLKMHVDNVEEFDYIDVLTHAMTSVLGQIVENATNEGMFNPSTLMKQAIMAGFYIGRTFQEMDTLELAEKRQLALPNYQEVPAS